MKLLRSILIALLGVPSVIHGGGLQTGTSELPSRAPFILELPDLGSAPITSVESHIPTIELRTLKLTLREPFATRISYGRIYTAINGEAANTICGNIRATRDGKVITCDLENKPRFRLQPGKNVIEISATDRNDASYYASYVLIAERAKTGAATRPLLKEPIRFSGRRFAVVIGVSQYQFQDAGLKDLHYADADARAIRDFLKRPEGGAFKPGDILFMENKGATTAVVRNALLEFLPRAGAGDLVFIYIASHGSPDPFDPRKLYLILNDTKVADLPRTALPMSEIAELLDHMLKAQRVVVLIDACHSAGIKGPSLVTGRQLVQAENNIFNLYASRLYREEGRAVLTSSDVNEISQEGPNWGGGHGVFTWSVLEGLGGNADINRDKIVTAGELFDYVSHRVREETDSRQNPRALAGTNSNFPLAEIRK